ncbi:ser/Thr protein phosphatase family protein [Thelonectria olida]|uniref:Ser/Thr protein phosphatase family protein n=1 Tax=Thelonectria olida TaxID=1576542 RepID=A0A9P9AUE4_9HYPO|nr:ser/Thr protein phosphatase family protein [Thelonectria olida]
MEPQASVKTRFLILSDTHGEEFPPDVQPNFPVDVAIHCGDLTEESKLDEFRTSLRLLKAIQAPLKLVIAGNHDFTLDTPAFKNVIDGAPTAIEEDLVRRNFGNFGEARSLLQQDPDIKLLDEGVHRFVLTNGALLTVYASPYTPSKSNWGFQYHPDQGHDWNIPTVDLVMTHGPPRGVLDRTDSKERAGCPQLFGAIARARPRLHCFGHIHEGWGAKLAAWRRETSEMPTHFADIDNDNSVLLSSLASLKAGKFDIPETLEEKNIKLKTMTSRRAFFTSHCAGDEVPLRVGEQTLFINGSIQGPEADSFQLPWVVDIDLAKA